MKVLRAWLSRHPLLGSWALLAIGMVAILWWAAGDTPLTAGQRAALVIVTVAVAGLCARVIGWEEDNHLANDVDTPSESKGEHD